MQLNESYLIYGMGKSGIATARAISQARGTAYIGDDASLSDTALENGVIFNIHQDPFPKNIKALITAPGMPYTHPKPHLIYELARQNNVPIMCDIEFFFNIYGSNNHARFIAITGTNGKSTVTALTTHLLNHAGHYAIAGGNIGRAMFDCPPPDKPTIYVLEISSYQADLCKNFAPDAVCFLNLTPDHLDRHGNMHGYFEAKKRLFLHLPHKGKAYVSGQEDGLDEWSKKIFDFIHQHNANIFLSPQQQNDIKALIKDNPYLAGHHNFLNALTSCAMVKSLNCVDFSGLKNYVGLPHRAEFIRKIDGITFINDSKATNADATKPALHAYKNIYWLAGGVAKEEGIMPLMNNDTMHVKHAFFYGEAGERFLKTAQSADLPCSVHDTLKDAFQHALSQAKNDESHEKTILLSPSCASFDAFKNFEHRGNFFKELVEAIEVTLKK